MAFQRNATEQSMRHGHTALFGATVFSDRSPEELAQLTRLQPKTQQQRALVGVCATPVQCHLQVDNNVSDSFDWYVRACVCCRCLFALLFFVCSSADFVDRRSLPLWSAISRRRRKDERVVISPIKNQGDVSCGVGVILMVFVVVLMRWLILSYMIPRLGPSPPPLGLRASVAHAGVYKTPMRDGDTVLPSIFWLEAKQFIR